MSELTKREIERIRTGLSLVLIDIAKKHDASSVGAIDELNALCDMALSALDNAEDAERYRFLKKHLHEPHAAAHFAAFCNWHPDDKQKLLSLDAAIDAARKEQK